MRCTPVVMELVAKLRLCVADPSAHAYTRFGDRDMRIMVAADSNVAIDNVLLKLDADAVFKAKNYNIVRLGSETKVQCG